MRQRKRDKYLKELSPFEESNYKHCYPGFGITPSHLESVNSVDELKTIRVSHQSLERLSEKIIKGMFYIEDRQFIDKPYKIDFFALHSNTEAVEKIYDALERWGTIHAREPGIVVKRAVIPEDRISSLFAIEIWRKFAMYATVMNSANIDI